MSPGLPKEKSSPTDDSKFKEHAKSEDLYDFETFFKPDTKSSLCKNLTKEIWDEYKDKSCKSGVSFKTCIFSGIANQDSGIGIYAGSHDSYTSFNKLFDKIIKEYHGHETDAKHQSDMKAEGLKNFEFTEE